MTRQTSRPAIQAIEGIRTIEEHASFPGSPGMVRFTIGIVDESGVFVVPQTFDAFVIEGEDYEKLCGDGAGWAEPGKPIGTFRNDDLWYFVDQARGV